MDYNIVRDGYDRIADNYAKQRDQFKNSIYLEKLADLLKPGATILDIGCGSGLPVDRFLVRKGYEVIGIDLSEKQIELARQNVPEASYQVKDMVDLRHGEYQVDAVVSFYAIFHTPREQHRELFARIHSFLSEHGLVLVTMGAGEWEDTEDDFHGTPMFWSHYGPEKNRQIVEDAGFEVLLDEIDPGSGEHHQILLARKR